MLSETNRLTENVDTKQNVPRLKFYWAMKALLPFCSQRNGLGPALLSTHFLRHFEHL